MNYDSLPTLEGSGERHSWDFFGRADELGTLSWADPESIVAAARLVRTGKVFNLDLPLNLPGLLTPTRPAFIHRVETIRNGRDDSLDRFRLQCSTQWDGLQHIRYRQYGFYGGRTEEELDLHGTLGIDRVAAHGIVGRGLCVDVAAYCRAHGLDCRPDGRTEISPGLLETVLDAEGLRPAKGDILLIRTGWMQWFLELASPKAVPPVEQMDAIGLAPTPDMARWLWDHRVAAIAADNPALEVLPVRREQGFLHHRLLPLMGMLIGEFWNFESLAEDCAMDRVYEGMFVSSPLNLPGGVGSPGNGYVIK